MIIHRALLVAACGIMTSCSGSQHHRSAVSEDDARTSDSLACREQANRDGARCTSVAELRSQPEDPGLVFIEGLVTNTFESSPCPQGAQCQPHHFGVDIADNSDTKDQSILLPIGPEGYQVGHRYFFLLELKPGYKSGFGFSGPMDRPIYIICSEPLQP
jgi:hypothetical protein